MAVKVAIAGIGGRGSWMVKSVAQREDTEIVGLCDTMTRKAEWSVEQQSLDVPVFGNIGDLLESVACDAVMVTTSDAHHAETAVPALEAGKFVFCEKPLETTIDRARLIIDADEAVGGKTFVGFNLRYAPLYATMKVLLEQGLVGHILTIQADEFYDGGRTYFRRWNRFRAEGGGLWITKACHDLDLLTWLAATKPVRVYATDCLTHYVPKDGAGTRCSDCAIADDCPDRAPASPSPLARIREECGGEPWDLCLYNAETDTFDHGIVAVTYERGLLATYTCNVVAGFSDRRIRVSGTKGTLEGHLGGKTITFMQRNPSASKDIPYGVDLGVGHGGADRNILDSFFDFVRGAGVPKCRPREAAIPVALGLAATRSGDEHREVIMNDLELV